MEALLTHNHARLFLRDDDVGELTPALKAFVSVFAERHLPVSYQIIPVRLTDECARFLLDLERQHPGLIEFGQHGLAHEMVLHGKRLKREFGPERSLGDQTADIVEGSQILRDRLGSDRAIATFTPPQHKFDGNTIRAAHAAGYKIFSSACYPTLHHRLAYAGGRMLGLSSILHHGISYHRSRRPEADIVEVSIALAVDDGRRRRLYARDIARALATGSRHTDAVGLMFHHALYDTAESQAELVAIADVLASCGPESFHRLGTLAEGAGRSHRLTEGA